MAQIEKLKQPGRVVVLALNVLAAASIHFFIFGTIVPTGSGESVWYLAAIAHWIIVLVAAPFFNPPKDALSTAITVAVLLGTIDLSPTGQFQLTLEVARYSFLTYALIVAAGALTAIFFLKSGKWVGEVAYRLTGALGRSDILFTPAVVISAVGFYQSDLVATVVILAFWTAFILVEPFDLIGRVFNYVRSRSELDKAREFSGVVLRIDDPGIVRVRLEGKRSRWKLTNVHLAYLPGGRPKYVLPLFSQTQNEEVLGTGIICDTPTGIEATDTEKGLVFQLPDGDDQPKSADLTKSLSGVDHESRLVGIVVENSTIETIRFQVVRGAQLSEGMVVFANVRGEMVHFQVLDASTAEESFEQNPFGAHIVTASQLGVYDDEKGFLKYPWLPDMNQPIFWQVDKVATQQPDVEGILYLGEVPDTGYRVPIVQDDLRAYHSAILGVTGTGKTEFVFDLLRDAVNRGNKVFVVDFTGEYVQRLADLNPISMGVSAETIEKFEGLLFDVDTGEYRASAEKKELKKFVDEVRPAVNAEVSEFLESEDADKKIAIFELPEISNTKATIQATEMYISTIMNWARSNRCAREILIVLEEAHTIIPEQTFAADKDTQWVVGKIGQIALQGRKYGVGLMLVSQRTALVSKTILSQCNTHFVHSLVDQTSLSYLENVLGKQHIKAIPNLRFLEFIAHGKAIKSERPLIARRVEDPAKREASAALNKPLKQEEAD
ncbi:ATP-binding protein [Maricaulis sp.]|uniref:ATP-binding protein n=1 Tax=Maricaulis sp. TaxID=1486257 RepID=UPI00260E2D5D|nr:ATP-binding protein [Maricaulis sp.]